MLNEEHLRLLRSGVDVWNEQRAKDLLTNPNLQGADLSSLNLRHANLRSANLQAANLDNANLFGACLEGANLKAAHLHSADLTAAKLREAQLTHACIHKAILANADFEGAHVNETIFTDINLSEADGLQICRHGGPSTVDHRTLIRSEEVPDEFWRGCGLPKVLIDLLPSLRDQAGRYYSCFISYASEDQKFADLLHTRLSEADVDCWFAGEDMRTGDRILETINERIKTCDKLLVLLSERSISSDWVEKEVKAAMAKEGGSKTVLLPVRIDEVDLDSNEGWAGQIKRTHHIRDFSSWKDPHAYEDALKRLFSDLEVKR